MARSGKPAGNKKTSFGKRTVAERSFRENKRSKPEFRGNAKDKTGNKKFASPHFDKTKPRGEERPSFGSRSESDRPFKKNPGSGFRRDDGKPSPKENRFSRSSDASKPRFNSNKPRGEGKSSFERKSGSGPFQGNKEPRSFSRKREDDRPGSFRDRSFSKPEEGKSPKGSDRPWSSDKPRKSPKPFDRKKEDGFSKFKKEEKPPRTRPDGDSKFVKSDHATEKKPSDFEKPFIATEKKAFAEPAAKQHTLIPQQDGGLIRLNKFMANSGVGSRREADELIKMGLVTVNGETVTEMGHKVKLTDDVRYEGRKLKAEPLVYVLLNKPKGFITTTDDPEERKTVMDLVASACKERIYPVGRLDRNTTGLLLLTNDGDLADKLTHPSYNAKKIYKVELDRPLSKNDFQKILDGVYFDEGRAIVDDLAIVSDDGKEIGIEIHIGWNRIVRRIFEALGYQIERLDRVMYAGLDKKDLGRGQWRFLKPEEIVRLKHFQG